MRLRHPRNLPFSDLRGLSLNFRNSAGWFRRFWCPLIRRLKPKFIFLSESTPELEIRPEKVEQSDLDAMHHITSVGTDRKRQNSACVAYNLLIRIILLDYFYFSMLYSQSKLVNYCFSSASI